MSEFIIDSDIKAEWALGKIKEHRAEMQRFSDFYAEQNRKAQAELDHSISGLEGRLREYFETVPHKEAKTQSSYVLPSGKLVMKKGGVDYGRDDKVLLPWAQERGFIRTKIEPAWGEIKKHIEATGELPEGVNVVTVTDRFEVKI